MELIDRYINAVTERLPAESREDVGKELRSNIEDMLPDGASETDIKEVLEKLGSPKKLAEEYNPVKRYLIGPALYDNYISVLKLVVSICALVFTVLAITANAVEMSTGTAEYNFINLFTDLISSVIEGCIQAVLWVTVIFAILERAGMDNGKIPFASKPWTVDELPEYPQQKGKKISRVGASIAIFFTILFTAVLCFQPGILLISLTDDGVIHQMPLLNTDRLLVYIPFILLIAAAQLGILVWKFIVANWNIPLAAANTFVNALICTLMVFMVTDGTIINQKITDVFLKLSEQDTSGAIPLWWSTSVNVFILVFIIISIVDSVAGFLRCRKR